VIVVVAVVVIVIVQAKVTVFSFCCAESNWQRIYYYALQRFGPHMIRIQPNGAKNQSLAVT